MVASISIAGKLFSMRAAFVYRRQVSPRRRGPPALMAALAALGSCAPDSDIDAVRVWAAQCGMSDLKLFFSGEDARRIVVSEPRIGGQPWGDPTATERAILNRQSKIAPVIRCMEPKAKAAGLTIEYPVSIEY